MGWLADGRTDRRRFSCRLLLILFFECAFPFSPSQEARSQSKSAAKGLIARPNATPTPPKPSRRPMREITPSSISNCRVFFSSCFLKKNSISMWKNWFFMILFSFFFPLFFFFSFFLFSFVFLFFVFWLLISCFSGTDPIDMRAQVTSPSGKTEDAEMIDLADSTYKIKFVPNETGLHTVSVKQKNQHIPGSPFQFTVGPLKDGGPHRVRAGGPGLERGEVGEQVRDGNNTKNFSSVSGQTKFKHIQNTFKPYSNHIQTKFRTLSNTFETHSKHIQNTFEHIQTKFKTLSNTFKTHSKHIQNIFKPNSNHIQNTFKTRLKHIQNTFKPHSNHIKPRLEHIRNTFKTHSKNIPRNTEMFERFLFTIYGTKTYSEELKSIEKRSKNVRSILEAYLKFLQNRSSVILEIFKEIQCFLMFENFS